MSRSGVVITRLVKFVPAGTLTWTDTAVPSGTHRYEVRSVDLRNILEVELRLDGDAQEYRVITNEGDVYVSIIYAEYRDLIHRLQRVADGNSGSPPVGAAMK